MSDEKETWQQIVAAFDEPPTGDQPWPDIENLPADDESDQPGEPGDGDTLVAEPEGDHKEDASGDGAQATTESTADDVDEDIADEDFADAYGTVDAEGHFEPPAPPPLPRLDPITKIAWIALFGGPVYLLLSVIFGWRLPGLLAFAAVGAFIGGFVILIMRMGDGNGDGGDGAVV